MTIDQLEQHIKNYGSLMATALLQYEQTGSLVEKDAADGYKKRMEEAIAERDKKAKVE